MKNLLLIFALCTLAAGQSVSGSGSATGNGSLTALTNGITAPSITSYTATPTVVASGGSSILSWIVAGSTPITISIVNLNTPFNTLCAACLTPNGTISTGPITSAGNYQLTASNASGAVTQTVAVSLTNPPTVTLTATCATCISGDGLTPATAFRMNSNAAKQISFTWATTNATTTQLNVSNNLTALVTAPVAGGTLNFTPSGAYLISANYQQQAVAGGTTVLSAVVYVVVVQIGSSLGDNRYCGLGDVPQFGGTMDGPALLPTGCFYTGLDGRPSGLHIGGGA